MSTDHRLALDRSPYDCPIRITAWRYRWACTCGATGAWQTSATQLRRRWRKHLYGVRRTVAKETTMRPDYCPCCFGDPELVCAACGEHACWAGRHQCEQAGPAGVVTRAEFEEREKRAAADREEALTELVRQAEELGLYDLEIKQCPCGRMPPCRHLDAPDHPPTEAKPT